MLDELSLCCASIGKVSIRKWISVALAYFHRFRLPRKVGKAVKDADMVDSDKDGIAVNWNGNKYWVPLTFS